MNYSCIVRATYLILSYLSDDLIIKTYGHVKMITIIVIDLVVGVVVFLLRYIITSN